MSEPGEFEHTHDPGFWEAIYDEAAPPWDLGAPHPTLAAALALGLLEDRRRVLVPGAGFGHDALLLAEAGHDTVAVDFAEPAIRGLRARAAERGLGVDTRRCDIFALFDEPRGSFDALFEYTCFCAIDPALRPRYRDLATHLVRPGGRLLMLAFPLGRETSGPPHGVDLAELKALFEADWLWLFDSAPAMTPAPRAAMERLVVLERRGGS